MKALNDFKSDLIDLFAFGVEGTMALTKCYEWLIEFGADPRIGMETPVDFGKGDPNTPGAKYHYTKTYG